jgi:hypothetical protein
MADNTTSASSTPTFTPFYNVYRAIVPKLAFSFSCVQQVHIKLKAEAAVMFVFYTLKQTYAYFKAWLARRAERRLLQERSAEKEKKKTKRKKRKQRKRK